MVKAQPGNVGIKNADRFLDGRLHVRKTGPGILSVKAGENIGVSMMIRKARWSGKSRDRRLPDSDKADQAHDTFKRAPRKEAPNRQGARDL